MAKTKALDGTRDLSLIRASGSTARVLNLALVFERFGATDDFGASPLFRSRRLNQALIVKHALRANERDLFDRPEQCATKIVFPYSVTELGLGGGSIMVGEKRFDELFRAAVGGLSAADVEADVALLGVLAEVPSFDPFLLREQLRRLGRAPAPCFFDISDADIASIIAFVAREIAPLVNMAFGARGRYIEKLAHRLAEKLMTDENAELLAPLRETLRLSPAQYREGVFAWKGLLYYKWMLGDLTARHDVFVQHFRRCAIVGADRETRREIERLQRFVLSKLDLALMRASEETLGYTHSFAALMRGETGAFRDFLIAAPMHFIPLGEAIGAVKHIQSFWGFRFPDTAAAKLDAVEAGDLLRDFGRMLAAVDCIREDSDDDELLL